MLSKFIAAVVTVTLIAGSAGSVTAGPAALPLHAALKNSAGDIVLAASKAKKPARHTAVGGLKSKGRVVKDTCPGNNQACIDELVANCDKAGGGLSTWPDGSVDCYVVGIHDQP